MPISNEWVDVSIFQSAFFSFWIAGDDETTSKTIYYSFTTEKRKFFTLILYENPSFHFTFIQIEIGTESPWIKYNQCNQY